MEPGRLLSRFLRYVQVDTTADDTTDRYPSSNGLFELGRMLVDELKAMGIEDVVHNDRGIVIATLPGNTSDEVPTVALNSHLDTSPETTGKNVQPQVIQDYDGSDIVLPGNSGKVIRREESPELNDLIGCTPSVLNVSLHHSPPTDGRWVPP